MGGKVKIELFRMGVIDQHFETTALRVEPEELSRDRRWSPMQLIFNLHHRKAYLLFMNAGPVLRYNASGFMGESQPPGSFATRAVFINEGETEHGKLRFESDEFYTPDEEGGDDQEDDY